MPVIKLFAEVVDKKNQIVVSGSNIKVAAEIKNLLQSHSHIDCLNIGGNYETLSEISNLSTIIHFAGFSPQTLSDTLDHTTVLYRLLQVAASYKGKFILVLPNTRSYLYHTAITLTNQFSKNNQLSYQIIEVAPGSDPEETASEILKKIIYKFQREKKQDSLPIPPKKSTTTSSTQIPLKRTPGFNFKINPLKIFFAIFATIFTPYIISVFSLGSVVLGSSCVVKKQLTDVGCIHLGYYGSLLNTTFSKYLPGLSEISVSFGFPIQESFSVFENLRSSHTNLRLAKNNAVEMVKNLQTGEAISKNGSMLVTNLAQLSEDLARLQADLRAWYAITPNPPKDLADAAIMVGDSREVVGQIQSVVSNYSDFFPPDRKINYALLVMDNFELRSGGGTIGSAIVFSINEGKLEQPRVFSTNNQDSNFVGEVEAPPDFQAITGSKTWLLRDSNWEPDFSIAANQVAWFVEKETGQKIDVVAAVNLNTLAKLTFLVPEFSFDGQKVTTETFQNKYLESLTKNSYTSKFLHEYSQALTEKFIQSSDNFIDKLLNISLEGILTNNVLVSPVSFRSQGIQSAGWDGSLSSYPCRSQIECVQQYLHFFDTNLSVNKTDSYVKKSSDLNVTIEPGIVTKNAKISYENTSQPGVWPGGNYKNYLRIFTEKTSKLTSLKINGTQVPQNRFAVTEYGNLNQISLLFEVPAGGKTDVELQTQLVSNTKSKFHFQLDIQPQPGQTNIPAQLTINYPETWFSTVFANKSKISPSVASPGLLRYNPDLSRKVQIDIDLAPAQNTQP